MPGIVIVGVQWGDEGKGKATDLLGERTDWVVKFNGGNNAGHTVVVGDEKYALHLLPSGILSPGVRMPEGSRCSAYFSSPTTTVWPALLPPLNLTTYSTRLPRRSVARPLPSSPHWAPVISTAGISAPPLL